MQRKNAEYKENKRTRIVRGCLLLLLSPRVSPFSFSTSGIYLMKVPLPNNNNSLQQQPPHSSYVCTCKFNTSSSGSSIYDKQQSSIQYKINVYKEKCFYFEPVRISRTKSIGKKNKKKEHKTSDTPTFFLFFSLRVLAYVVRVSDILCYLFLLSFPMLFVQRKRTGSK